LISYGGALNDFKACISAFLTQFEAAFIKSLILDGYSWGINSETILWTDVLFLIFAGRDFLFGDCEPY